MERNALNQPHDKAEEPDRTGERRGLAGAGMPGTGSSATPFRRPDALKSRYGERRSQARSVQPAVPVATS